MIDYVFKLGYLEVIDVVLMENCIEFKFILKIFKIVYLLLIEILIILLR